ncbi:MAG: efflux RND transporter periplasmic adaptor subunit [Flavitalea sp.]
MLITIILTNTSCKNSTKESTLTNNHDKNAPLLAEGFVVKVRAMSENIEVPGTIQPFETTEIRPEIAGRIVELNIPEGRVVQQGSMLAKLFDGDLQAQLQKLQVQLSIAQKTSERQKELIKIGGISQQEIELGELAVNNLQADIQLIKVSILKTRIVAPYTGKVGLRNISLGAYVTQTNILTTISQVNDLKLEFTVPEKYSDKMTKGRPIAFRIEGSGKGAFTANVMATESNIEANTRSLKVRALVKEKDEVLVPGGFASVSLEFGNHEQRLVIPTEAVIPKAREKKVVVYRNGNPEFKTITTGIRDSSFVQVTDGLKVGDTVVITGLLAIRPESKVELTKVN